MIMPIEWWMDKAALLFILWLMGRMMMIQAKAFVVWGVNYYLVQIKGLGAGKGGIKAAAGVVALGLAPTVVDIIKIKLLKWAEGGGKDGK